MILSMSAHPFYNFLSQRIARDLPGENAQLKMCPIPLNGDRSRLNNRQNNGYPSSVLIPLYPGENGALSIILTLRSESIRHAGQISFPGGRSDKGEPPVKTALRETWEEVGIPPEKVDIAGSITPLYLNKSDNQITPFVGFLREKPQLIRNPDEVEEVIIATLDQLLSEKYIKREVWDLNQRKLEVPYWNIHRVPLWGATAMMLSELLELYREFTDSP
jgi:8-oxo-dGTP pyrophosphatase MutT (NUDIX family)